MRCIKNGRTAGQYCIDLNAHDFKHLFIFGNVKLSQVQCTTKISHHANLATVISQAVTQNRMSPVFNHSSLYRPVDQQALARFPMRAVGSVNTTLVQK